MLSSSNASVRISFLSNCLMRSDSLAHRTPYLKPTINKDLLDGSSTYFFSNSYSLRIYRSKRQSQLSFPVCLSHHVELHCNCLSLKNVFQLFVLWTDCQHQCQCGTLFPTPEMHGLSYWVVCMFISAGIQIETRRFANILQRKKMYANHSQTLKIITGLYDKW